MVRKEKILIVGTYPIYPAMHGGQKRTQAIIEYYRECGHEVSYISLCTPGNYPRYSKLDLRATPDMMSKLEVLPSRTFTEIMLCRLFADDEQTIKNLESEIRRFEPTLIQYEQGYAYECLRHHEDRLKIAGIPIVFSSHNVEWIMKKEIALNHGHTTVASEVAKYVEIIKDLEITLLNRAEYSIVVSNADKEKYSAYTKKQIIVCPNGIDERRDNPVAANYWRQLFARRGIEKTAVFIGSAHPPNLHGFMSMIDAIGFLDISQRIIVVGGVADMIRELIRDTIDPRLATLENRTLLLGKISDDRLTGLLSVADVIILPITGGGGSNLKTAEALTSTKVIVGTTQAFRSYEKFMHADGVYIADTPKDFRGHLVKAFADEHKQIARQGVDELYWKKCLQPLQRVKGVSR